MTDPYASLLQHLQRAGLPFAVIGTYALRAYYPDALRDYALPDCDAVLPDSALNPAIGLLLRAGWQLSLWGEPVLGPVNAAEANGKFYLRARQGAHTLDLTYECPIAWADMGPGRVMAGGIPYAALAHVVALKRLKGKPSDLALLARLEGIAPRTHLEARGNA